MDFSSSEVCTIVIVLREGIGNYDFLNCFSGTYAVPSMVSPILAQHYGHMDGAYS